MPFQQTGHIDTVALTCNSNTIAPFTSSIRRYSSIASSSPKSGLNNMTKFASHRSSAMPSIQDRSGYTHRSRTFSDYSKPSYNITRLSPSFYSDYYTSNSTTSSLSSSLSDSIDLMKYSPHFYVPNIQRDNNSSSSSSGIGSNSTSSGQFSTADLLSSDEFNEGKHSDSNFHSGSSSSSSSSSYPWTHKKTLRCTPSADNEEYNSRCKYSSKNKLHPHVRNHRCGLQGLRNIGNTCFMNSVIQCLSNTRLLLEYLLNEQYLTEINTSTSSMKGTLIEAFSQVIQELWKNESDYAINTSSLKSQIQKYAPRFIGYSQQDAQEFLRYLLEGLHEDVNRVIVKSQPIHTDIPDSYSDSMKAAESWKRYLRSEDSTIVDLFVGQLRSSLHWAVCDHVSVTFDPFWDLSLPIPSRNSTVKLNQCLEYFTKEEILDDDERPMCSKCQVRKKCTKSFSIQKFPKILVIHLKRFSPMERFRGKLNVLVDFPLTDLDLSPYAAPRVHGCTYNLYGVVNHTGTTYSGHYTAVCKHPYSGEWHEYNDGRVTSIPSRSVVSSEAYLLFYEQQPYGSHI